MKKAPCARLGMRIRPKISEKPDDNRNRRRQKATLFSVWMIQNCHCIFRLLRGEAGPRLLCCHCRASPGNPSFFEKMDPRVKPGGDVWWRGGTYCSRFLAGG